MEIDNKELREHGLFFVKKIAETWDDGVDFIGNKFPNESQGTSIIFSTLVSFVSNVTRHLTDDNFAQIIAAIMANRHLYKEIEKDLKD